MLNDDNKSEKLIVKTLSDRSISLDLQEYPTIGSVRAHLQSTSQETSSILLISRGVPLTDDSMATSADRTIHWFYYEPAAFTADPADAALDWDAKNRLRCYRALYLIHAKRNFKGAAELLVDVLATFQETSLISFGQCVKYCVLAALLSMSRPALLRGIIRSSEVLEVIGETLHLESLLRSFYGCEYGQFFQSLGIYYVQQLLLLTCVAAIEQSLKEDWLLHPHYAYMVKELRIRAYSQMLYSYRSLSLESMAAAFGVSVGFIDRDLSRFIAAGRLDCVIDLVQGLVITNPPDLRNQQYLQLVKEADVLMGRLQKLSHLIAN